MERPTWDDLWMEVAQLMSKRSLCERAQVGVVIVNAENRIVSTGYNGPPHGFAHRDESCPAWCERGASNGGIPTCPSAHAEQNAFMAADRSAWQRGTLYVTGHVCTECAKLIANSGLARIVVQPDDVDRAYRDPDASYRFIRSLGIGVEILSPRTPERVGGIATDWA